MHYDYRRKAKKRSWTGCKGCNFWGRSAEVDILWRLLERGDVLLTGPRRYGKSSLDVRSPRQSA